MPTDVDRVKFSLREYRSVSVPDEVGDTGIKTRHPLAIELTYNTLISSEGDAVDFGDYVMNVRSEARHTWQALLAKDNYPLLEVGDTITLFYPRFGLSGGKNFIVKRLKRDSETSYLETSLYGPE